MLRTGGKIMENDDGTVGDRQEAGQVRRLSSNEEAIASELRRTDPHLAGLFQRGLALTDEIDEPGVRYLVAHVGRELSRAIVSTLTGETTIPSAPAPDDAELEDRFRKRIASVLNLPETHPNVAAWFRSHQALVGGVHWRNPPPPAAIVRESFVTLVGLLFGRIAPYFDTQAELDQLLEITTPTTDDAERLQRCTVRYTQRRYFFTRLADPKWLAPLAVVGAFQNPPDRLIHEDGAWSIQQWPEGDALARLAGGAPTVAIRELVAVPRDNQNPAVWKAVATAALALSPADALTLVPVLVDAVKHAPPILFPRSVIEVIQRLAEAGHRDAAFELTDALLFVKRAAKKSVAEPTSSEGK
jgi:hypothetical protein